MYYRVEQRGGKKTFIYLYKFVVTLVLNMYRKVSCTKPVSQSQQLIKSGVDSKF